MVSAHTGKPIWTPPWCSKCSLVCLWNSSNAAYHHPHQSLSSIHPSNCWCELLYLVTHQLHFFWCRFPWKLFVCLSLLLIQQPWLEVSVERPYAETHRWAKLTVLLDLCERERPFILAHDLIRHYDQAHPVLWPGSSGTMTWAHGTTTGLIRHLGLMTWAHLALWPRLILHPA